MQMDVRRAAEEESSLRRQQHQVVLSNRGNGGVGGMHILLLMELIGDHCAGLHLLVCRENRSVRVMCHASFRTIGNKVDDLDMAPPAG